MSIFEIDYPFAPPPLQHWDVKFVLSGNLLRIIGLVFVIVYVFSFFGNRVYSIGLEIYVCIIFWTALGHLHFFGGCCGVFETVSRLNVGARLGFCKLIFVVFYINF